MRRAAAPIALAALIATAVISFPTASPAVTHAGGKAPLRPASTAPIDVAVGSDFAGPPIRAGFVGITTEFRDMFQIGRAHV